jgi:hypothetical protein
MFACKDATEHMTDEREGALSGWLRARYRLHLTLCPYCRAFRRQLDTTVALARTIPRDEVPENVMNAALAAFRAPPKER